jgi:hypothetical protein
LSAPAEHVQARSIIGKADLDEEFGACGASKFRKSDRLYFIFLILLMFRAGSAQRMQGQAVVSIRPLVEQVETNIMR